MPTASLKSARAGTRLRAVTVLIAGLAAACGGKETPTSPSSTSSGVSVSGSLAFGSIEVGQSRDLTLTISNGNSTAWNFTSLSISGGISTHFSATPTSGSVPPRGSLPITVRFTPQSGGTFSGTLTVNGDATSGTTTAPVTAAGVAPVVTVIGVVSDSATNRPVSGVRVTARGLSTTTDGNGYYSIPGVEGGQVPMTFTVAGYNPQSVTVPVNGDTRRDIRLVPFWRFSGTGNTVFDMPTSVSRVRIRGYYPSRSSNFIVRIGGRLVVNELLGTSWSSQRYDGLHLTGGGVVEITNSRDVEWEFIQEQ